jgi:uncharacterized membrane protein
MVFQCLSICVLCLRAVKWILEWASDFREHLRNLAAVSIFVVKHGYVLGSQNSTIEFVMFLRLLLTTKMDFREFELTNYISIYMLSYW